VRESGRKIGRERGKENDSSKKEREGKREREKEKIDISTFPATALKQKTMQKGANFEIDRTNNIFADNFGDSATMMRLF
jgi:hypothetical protein